MTLVAAFASSTYAVMITDRRRTQLESGVHLDDVTKLHKVNNKVIVGFAGIYHHVGEGRFIGMAERTINDCFYRVQDITPIDTVAEIYSNYILNRIAAGDPKEMFEMTFHLAGLDSNDRYILARVSQFEDFKPILIEPQDNGVIWGLSIAEYSPAAWLDERLNTMTDKSMESIERLANELLHHTAEHDKYVSDSYDILVMSTDSCRLKNGEVSK